MPRSQTSEPRPQPEDFQDSNQKTLAAYDINWSQHQIRELDQPDKPRPLLDRMVAGLDKSARIFEFGSGPGYAALYLQSRGYAVNCSEASRPAVDLLRQQGLPAEQINALTDDFPGDCDLILAIGVVVHFNRDELQLVCDKVFAALSASGRFGFTTVDNQVEKWHLDRRGNPHYINHLPESDLRAILARSGFGRVEIERQSRSREDRGRHIIAFK